MLVELENVSKTYRLGRQQVVALRGVSLAIAEGEFIAVEGPSGSGKSTLLNLIGLLDRPTEGRICFDGKPVSALSDAQRTRLRRRHIGFVFQFFNLLPTLNAEENVALTMLLDGVAAGEARDRAREVLARTGLAERLQHRPEELSGGERQRVAVARALAMKPSLLLADEPTGNLDSAAGHLILDLLRDCCKQQGCAVVLVTHDAEAAAHAARRIRLRDGILEAGAVT